MKTLKHDDMIKINGLYGTVGTIPGYYAAYRESDKVPAAMARAKERGHQVAWAVQELAVITSSKGYYEQRDAKRATAIDLEPDELVTVDGIGTCKTHFLGNYASIVHFLPVEG